MNDKRFYIVEYRPDIPTPTRAQIQSAVLPMEVRYKKPLLSREIKLAMFILLIICAVVILRGLNGS